MSTPATTPLIEARQVIPAGETAAFTLCLQRHDALCLIGPDSTRLCAYLRTLAGVEPPQQGELLLFGQCLTTLDKRRWREQRQQLGFVARNAPLLSVLRGLDNVMLPALYHKRLSPSEARARATALLAQTGCSGDIHQLPAYLSQQQRLQLAIARATILDPAVLFIEQPFAGLSLAEQEPIYHYLLDSRDTRAQVLATHNLRLVHELATQILFIGTQQVYHFTSWHALVTCSDTEVMQYLQNYQQQYQPVQTHV
jgi:ABC-type transporter Mla maintaining outer membrane lipid asymmetry ATPase subunit MlaF